MANAHFFSAGLELPNQGLAPVVTANAQEDLDKKDGDGESIVVAGVEERVGSDGVVHEQAMPEGPTVTRWEEWAYVSGRPRWSGAELVLVLVL